MRIPRRAIGVGSWRRAGTAPSFAALALVALLTLALAGCGGAGASTSRTGGASSGGSTLKGPPQTGLTVMPCHSSLAAVLPPTITLQSMDARTPVSAHVGDIISISLDGQHRWSLNGLSAGGALTPLTAQGALVNGDCLWQFKASAPGDATVNYSGQPLCDPTQQCPQYALALTYTIRVA